MGGGILTFFGVLYACNHDQYAVMLIVGYFVWYIYAIIVKVENKRYIHTLLFYFISAVVGYGISFFAPGHNARIIRGYGQTMGNPDYLNWSSLEKLYKGYTTTVANLLFLEIDIMIFFVFGIFLIACLNRNKIYRMIGMFPFLSIVLVTDLGYEKFVVFYDYSFYMPDIGSLSDSYRNVIILLFTIVYVMLLFAAIIFVLNIDEKEKVILLLVLAGGTRVMMGLSASLYASSFRTFTIFIYSLIICSIIVWNHIKGMGNQTIKMVYEIIAWCVVIKRIIIVGFTYINSIS